MAGASKGIGAVTAEVFASAGSAVVLAARDAVAIESVAKRTEANGGQAIAVRADVADGDSEPIPPGLTSVVRAGAGPTTGMTNR